MRIKEKIILAAIFSSAAFFIAPKIASAQIIINEIMYDLAGADDKHEWVEIYNNGASPVDLTEWKFNDGDAATNHALNAPPKNSSRGSLILGANEYLLLADDATTIANDLSNYAGTIIDTVLNLSNTSATLKLLDKDGVETTTTTYNKDTGATGNGRTLEWNGAALKESLIDDGTPGRANSVLNSTGTTPSPAPSAAPRDGQFYGDSPAPTSSATASPTPTPGYQYSQKVFINEFLPWPEDDNKEWVELANLDSATINLSGWQIDDGNASTSPQEIPANITIAPGEFLVVSFNKNVLNNDGDKVRLLWPDDQVVHAVAYAKATQGQAVAKFNNGWLWTNQPTPGQANKKSFTGTVKTVSAPTNNARAVTTIDSVAAPTGAPAKAAQLSAKTPMSPVIPALNASSAVAGAPTGNIDLIAAVANPTSNVKNNNYLALAGVLLLALLSASGFIYYKRLAKPVDGSSFDD